MIWPRMVCAGVALGAVMAASEAQASLIIDLRVHGSATPKQISVSALNDVVNLDVYAIVTGQNASTADDGFQSFFGSFVGTLTNGGAATGDFSTFTAASTFSSTVQPGTVQDINGQAGMDVGFATGGASTDYIYGRAGSMQIGNGAASGAGQEWLVGSLTWTVKALPETGTTALQFLPRTSYNNAGVWREDGANKNAASAGTSFGAGSDVVVAVPEPAALGLVGLSVLALVRRRHHA